MAVFYGATWTEGYSFFLSGKEGKDFNWLMDFWLDSTHDEIGLKILRFYELTEASTNCLLRCCRHFFAFR